MNEGPSPFPDGWETTITPDEEARLETTEAKIERTAVTDELTGMLNRKGFYEQANRDLARFERENYEGEGDNAPILLMFDIDHFKKINDRFGHSAGDQALEELGAAMEEVLRDSDLMGRIGGEEFAILLPEKALFRDLENAENFLPIKIRNNWSERLKNANEEVFGNFSPSFSMGITYVENKNPDGVPPRYTPISSGSEDSKRADRLMYMSKEDGRNKITFQPKDLDESPIILELK